MCAGCRKLTKYQDTRAWHFTRPNQQYPLVSSLRLSPFFIPDTQTILYPLTASDSYRRRRLLTVRKRSHRHEETYKSCQDGSRQDKHQRGAQYMGPKPNILFFTRKLRRGIKIPARPATNFFSKNMTTSFNPPPASARALLQVDPLYKNLTFTRLPVPKIKIHPDSTEHLIRVHTVAICNGELLWMKNFPSAVPTSKEQPVPTFDVAGTVVEAPPSTTFHPGDEVYARTSPSRTGCAQDYAIALTHELAHRPQRLTWAESAALPLSAQTAWQALFIQVGLNSIGHNNNANKRRILVTAASGGVGAWVVQLASLAGAEVIGTCGPQNLKLVQSLGAKEVLDYHITDLREWAQKPQNLVDIVIDCVGGKALEDAWWTVRDGGILISVFQPPEQVRPAGCADKDVKYLFFIMTPNGEQLEQITQLVDEGKCRPFVDSVWRFEDYKEAFERADSWRARGKVVLELVGEGKGKEEK